MSRINTVVASSLLLIAGVVGSSRAAEPGAVYAVNAAALATVMTYCSTRHAGLAVGSAGARCLESGRGLLADAGLAQRSEAIAQACNDPATYNRCMTPHIGRLVYDLNDLLKQRGL